MATTSKYFILPSAGDNFLDLELSYGTLSLQGQEIMFVGSAAVDMVFLRPEVTLDFTQSGSSVDKAYLTGNFADYEASYLGTTITLTRGSGVTAETLLVTYNATNSDQFVFADGTVGSYDLYTYLSDKQNNPAPIPAGETSLAPLGAAASNVELNANLKAFVLDASGETFATARPGMALTLVGSTGVDTVYVPDGATIDATQLGSSTDLIHFRGQWADYAKKLEGNTITFTRTVGDATESVKVIAGMGGLDDRLIFADGAVSSYNAMTALNGDITVVTGYDPNTVTPGLDRDAPVLTGAQVNGDVLTLTYSDAGILDAAHPPATTDFTVSVTPPAGSPGNVAVTAVAIGGKTVDLTLASPVANGSTVTLSYTGSGVNAIQDVSGNDAAALTNQAVEVPSGTLADGYIRDAHIYIDTDGDGTGDYDTGLTTNASGNFFLPPGTPSGTIIAIGGVNIDTGVPNTLVYKAPAGSTTVSPLTTLIQTYVDTNGGTATDAETAVQTALGLPAGVDLLTFDPLAADPADADAVAVQKAATQIATIASLAASAPAPGSTATDAANEVMNNLVTTVTGAGAGSVDLGNGATATGLLGASTTVAGTDVSNAVAAIGSATTFTGIANAQSQALDTTAPAAPIAAPDLLAASDTGRLNNDDVTQDTTPTLRVRLDITALDGTAAVAGDTVKLFDGATEVGSGILTPADIANGFIDLTTGALAAGVHSLTAKLTDVAGNPGGASTALSLNIDTTAPTTSIGNMALSADTGSSSSDGLTKTANQTITGTLSAALGADERLYGSTDGGATWKDVNGSVSGTNIAWIGVTLQQGGNALALQVRDFAGNAGPTANQTFTLDTAAPTAPGMTESSGLVTVSGLEAGATWEYSTNAGTSWTAGTGTSFTLPTGNYAVGAIQVRQTDAAGNVSSAASNGSLITMDPPPVFQSAAVDGATLVLNYDEALDGVNPPGVGTFTVSVNGSSSGVSAVAVSGSQVTLTLGSAVVNGDTVQVGYTDPTAGNDANAVQDAAGNDATSLPLTAVTNNTPAGPDVTAPVLQSATVNGNILTLTYNEALDQANQPASSYYQVSLADGTGRSVNNVAISGNSVVLTLSSPVANGVGVTLSYNDPTAGNDVHAIQDAAGNDAASLSGRAVTNTTPAGDVPGNPGIVNASFTEAANSVITLTFSEPVFAQPSGNPPVLLKNGSMPINMTTTPAISGSSISFTTDATLTATDYVVVQQTASTYFRDAGGNDMNPIPGTLIIGGSGINQIDLSTAGNLVTPILVRGNAGNDILIGSGSNDRLVGGGGSDTLNGDWGSDSINLNEATRASDTVVVPLFGDLYQSGSVPYGFADTVYAFDVSGTTTNDKLSLHSKTIAANASHVDGADAGTLAKHSIASGILTFEDISNTPILINSGNIIYATTYLERNMAVGQVVAYNYDSDGNGFADSLNVFLRGQNGDRDLFSDTVVKLAGVTGVTLGTTAGQNVVQLVDSTGPNVIDAATTANGMTLTFNETLGSVNFAGLTLQKGNGATLAAMTPTGAPAISVNTVTVATGTSVGANDYVLVTVSNASQQSATDSAGNTANLFNPGEVGVAVGGTGNTVIDLSGLAGNYGVHDPNGGNDTLTGNAGNNWIGGGIGNDTLSGGGGDDDLEGGVGADTMNGGTGADQLHFTQGDSTPVAFQDNGSAGVSNGDTYTFSGGADIITGGFDVTGPDGDRIDLSSLIPGHGLGQMSFIPNDGLVTDQSFYMVRGGYAGGVFTVNSAGADTLLVYDGADDPLMFALSQTAIVVQGILPSQLTHNVGSGEIYFTDTTPPVFQSAAVSGTTLSLGYNEALDGFNPPGTGNFAVNVNGSARGVNNVVVSGTQVILTLASTVASGDTVTVSYTDPTAGNDANALQDANGNDAASISNRAATNNTPAGDTTPPVNVGASFTNTANATITLNFDEAVTASSPAGLSLSLNPTDLNGWMGTNILPSGMPTGLGTSTINLPTMTTLTAADVVRMQYNAAVGDLRDLAGNRVPTGEIWIGGSGDSVIDLDWYSPWQGGSVTLRGNAGNDTLVGTNGGDVLIDGGGTDSLTGGMGADRIRLVENGTSIPYARDTVRVQPGESFAFYQGQDVSDRAMDIIAGSLTSPAGTGFDITSATAANHDVLDLPANQIAANVSHADGIDSGSFARHSVAGGIVTLEDASGAAILINDSNVAAAAAYLEANFTTPGTAAAFSMDTDGNGSVDSLVVFQDNGTVPSLGNLALPDTVVLIENLAGIGSATLGTTAGANVVQIVDTQAPMPINAALSSNGFAVDFSENTYATTGLALTMLKNGATAMTITGITGNGTPHLGIVTNQSLAATDWVLAAFSGANTGNSFYDASGNALIEDAGGFSFAEGGSGNNTIDLSALSGSYDLSGNAGNDTLIGASGANWIWGGTGADTLTGGVGGANEFYFEQGDSPARTAMNLGADNVLNTGDTLSFANGIDRITNFPNGDGVWLDTQYSDLFSLANAPGYMGQWNDKTPPSDGLAIDQGFFVVQGSYAGNVFTVNNTAGTDTLIVWDGDSSTAVTQTGILLSGVTPDHLDLYQGNSWISYVV